MSLPGSESQPDQLSKLPSKQGGKWRALLERAKPEELDSVLLDLRLRSRPRLGDYLLLVLSSALLAFAMSTNSILLLLMALLLCPFVFGNLGLALAPRIPSFGHALQSLLFWVLNAIAVFGAALLAAFLNPTAKLPFDFILQNGIVEMTIFVLASLLCARLFIGEHKSSPLLSVVLSLFCLLPVALAGWSCGETTIAWLEYLLLGFGRFLLSAILIAFVFSITGLTVRKWSGWLMSILIFALLGATVYAYLILPAYSPTEAMQVVPVSSPIAPTVVPATSTARPTLTPLPTQQATPQASPTAQFTATAMPVQARVLVEKGLVVRESPVPSATVVTYLNYNQLVWLIDETRESDNIPWQKIRTDEGQEGWVQAQFLERIAP